MTDQKQNPAIPIWFFRIFLTISGYPIRKGLFRKKVVPSKVVDQVIHMIEMRGLALGLLYPEEAIKIFGSLFLTDWDAKPPDKEWAEFFDKLAESRYESPSPEENIDLSWGFVTGKFQNAGPELHFIASLWSGLRAEADQWSELKKGISWLENPDNHELDFLKQPGVGSIFESTEAFARNAVEDLLTNYEELYGALNEPHPELKAFIYSRRIDTPNQEATDA